MEGSSSCRRRRSIVSRSSRDRRGNPSFLESAYAPGPAGCPRPAPWNREPVHEMARGPLGPGHSRRHRIPARRPVSVRNEGPGVRSLVESHLRPRIRSGHDGSRISETGGSPRAGTLSTVRLPTGERTVLLRETRNRRRTLRRARQTTPALAVA